MAHIVYKNSSMRRVGVILAIVTLYSIKGLSSTCLQILRSPISPSTKWKEIELKLNAVYGNQSEKVLTEVIKLVSESRRKYSKYRAPGNTKNLPLKGTGVTLTAYADQLQTNGKNNILGLKRLSKYLPIFTRHLLPFFKGEKDGGFSIENFKEIREGIGSWNNVRSLAKEKGINWIDWVLNHLDRAHIAYKRFLEGDIEHSNYFIIVENQPRNVFHPRSTPYLREVNIKGEGNKTVWMTFSEDQVDLNFKNPSVFLMQLENLLFYYYVGNADIIRIDAAPYAWKNIREGEAISGPYSNVHQKQIFDLLDIYAKILKKIDSNTAIIPENHFPWAENAPYLAVSDAVYDFRTPGLILNSFLTESKSDLSALLSENLPHGKTKVNFLGNHDGTSLNGLRGSLSPKKIQNLVSKLGQVAKELGGELPIGYAKIEGQEIPYEVCLTVRDLYAHNGNSINGNALRISAAHHLMFSIQGIPQVYLPQLIGEITDFQMIKKTGHRRNGNRPKYNFEEIEKNILKPITKLLPEQLLKSREWSFEKIYNTLENEGLLNSKFGEQRLIFAYLSKLIHSRTSLEESGLDPYASQIEVKTGNDAVVAVNRGNQTLAITNLSSKIQKIKLEVPIEGLTTLKDELSDFTVSISNNSLSIEVPPNGIYWFKL